MARRTPALRLINEVRLGREILPNHVLTYRSNNKRFNITPSWKPLQQVSLE